MTEHFPHNPNDAFDNAIELSGLSADETAPNYAGLFMYMHTDADGDHFKHIQTRRYFVSITPQP